MLNCQIWYNSKQVSLTYWQRGRRTYPLWPCPEQNHNCCWTREDTFFAVHKAKHKWHSPLVHSWYKYLLFPVLSATWSSDNRIHFGFNINNRVIWFFVRYLLSLHIGLYCLISPWKKREMRIRSSIRMHAFIIQQQKTTRMVGRTQQLYTQTHTYIYSSHH